MINYGDIFRLGNHRLMCGDATNRDDVYKLINGEHVNLVLTDPPYGVKIHSGYHRYKNKKKFQRDYEKECQRYTQKSYAKIIGDENIDTAKLHYKIVCEISDKLIFWGGIYFTDFLPVSKKWLVWYKMQALPNHSQAELAWTNIKGNTKVYTQRWNGAIRQGNCKLNPRPAVHQAQKPVELHIKILEDFSKENDVILDCFGGSGTTLIAAECCNRKCLMMEISPEYCEIIINRYRDLSGLASHVEKI